MDEVGAVLLTGLVAAAVAIWGIVSQRTIACRRATIDYLARIEGDVDHIDARRKFIELAKAAGGLAPWADEEHEKSTQAQTIRLILNSYELIAIGIQRGVLEYKLYKRWHKSGVLQMWIHAAPFVTALRGRLKNDAIFHEFEEMAKSMKDNHMPKRNWWLGRFF